MLTYVVLSITAYLVFKILRAPRSADATGYLLVSGLMPLPVYIIGRSVNAGVFPIDVCLLAHIVAHGRTALHYVIERRSLSTGVGALFGLSILATYSGVLNYFFVDPDPLKFYAFTIVKFWEYALLATLLIASRPDAAQLRKICAIVLAGILVYEIVHALHISGIVPLSGEEYFGPRAADDLGGAVPFSDRTGWFLTSYRVVIGGTASISAWFSLMVFEGYRGKMKVVAAATVILSVFSVLATSSRSDIAGLAVAAIVFVLYAPPRRWKAYVCAAIVVAGLYAALLTVFFPSAQRTTAMTRMSELWNPELRAEGNYADRSSDWTRLLSYLPEHPRELLIGVGPGNFRWYQAHRITINIYGHNSYLHWTGELGIGGFLLLLAWCLSVCLYTKKRLRSQSRICQLAARTCVAVVAGRMVAAWGAESLFGTDGMGYYSLFFVGVVYLLVSIASDVGATSSYFHVRPNRFKKTNTIVTEGMAICPR
jgi:O-antigen ligase